MHENDAPGFQSDGNLSILENQIFVYEFNATDPDGDALVYSILYGDDAHAFDLNESTGILNFIIPPDYENPEDNNTDNIYEATIQVSDGEKTLRSIYSSAYRMCMRMMLQAFKVMAT